MVDIGLPSENVHSRALPQRPRFGTATTLSLVLVAFALLGGCSRAHPAAKQGATAPVQPDTGPGGKEAPHANVRAELHGTGPLAYWLFEPMEPAPQNAPLIVFNHGWGAMDPEVYKAWIDHIVRRGNIVVYPLYQNSLRTEVKDFTPNAIAAVKDAIMTLHSEAGHVQPLLDKFALVGHSMGGPISANMAAMWKEQDLPMPRALMCVEPGKTWAKVAWATIDLADLSQIPADTLLLTVVGDQDHLVRDIDAKRIFRESTQVPIANKNYVTLRSDNHGEPALVANHMAPTAWAVMPQAHESDSSIRGMLRERLQERRQARSTDDGELPDLTHANRTLDALDFYGLWKLFDALVDAGFYGKDREYALGDTSEQRFMGKWSDGVPVKELVVTDHPSE
jgi:acetyl esterase/lipase